MEFLFRGKREFDKQWIFGCLVIDEHGEKMIIESKIILRDGHHFYIDSDIPVFFFQETIGMYTQKDDDEGEKIFDGDMVISKWEDGYKEIAIVSFKEGRWIAKGITTDKEYDLFANTGEVLIKIGNKFDNYLEV